jgi:hypothetical protein
MHTFISYPSLNKALENAPKTVAEFSPTDLALKKELLSTKNHRIVNWLVIEESVYFIVRTAGNFLLLNRLTLVSETVAEFTSVNYSFRKGEISKGQHKFGRTPSEKEYLARTGILVMKGDILPSQK